MMDWLNQDLPDEPAFVRPQAYTMTLASPKPWSPELEQEIKRAATAVRRVTVVESQRIDE